MALLPDQFPEAVQLVAFVLVQLRVVEPLMTTLAGLADRETVGGAGGVTDTLSVEVALSVALLQVSTNELSFFKELIISDPVMPLSPDQSPDAIQLSALLADQSRVTSPL